MDYSTEHYKYQRYQQYDPSHPQSYDPSHPQSYDPSTANRAYYAYSNQQYDHHHHHHQQQQHNAYYPPQDYSHHYHQGNAPIHSPGVPLPYEPTQDQQNAYYTQGAVENQQQLYHGPDPGELGSGSAVAMTQYAESMTAAQVAIQPEIGPSAHSGGGRRGVRKPFRGSGRGHFGYRGPKRSGSATPSRGRGRGQGGGRHISSNGAASTSNSAAALAEGPNARTPPSASGLGQASASVPAASLWPPPRMAWCEICRVDCNTVEILEQHKNGKRHKKNLRAHQSLQNVNNPIPGQLDVQMPILTTKPEVVEPVKVDRSEEKQPLPENLLLKASVDDNKTETEKQKDIEEKFEIPMVDSAAEPERKPSDHSRARGRGFKRKIRGGRGGKYVRTNEGRRRLAEPPKPKEVIPFICELCNVKCESKVVFDSHMVGKKHLSNLKRFHGHRALYGEAGLQALYPANFSGTQPSSIPQVQQSVNDPQIVLAQLLTYVLSQAQAPGFIASQLQGLAALAAAAAAAPVVMSTSGFGTQCHPNSQTQGSQATAEFESETPAVVDGMNQKQHESAELGISPTATTNSEAENGCPVSDAKDASLCQSSSVSVPSVKNNLGSQKVLSEPISENNVSPPECDIDSSGLVTQPGMDGDTQEPASE